MRIEGVVSVDLQDDGTLVVIRRIKSSFRLGNGDPAPDDVFRQVYAANLETGKIELVSHVVGRHTPSYVVPESFEFPPQ